MESINLSNVKLLEHYGVLYPPEGPRWKAFKCPFHDDRTASASSNGSGFVCFACGIKGDAITLIKEREGLDYQSAIEFYEGIYGEEYPALRRTAFPERKRVNLSGEKRAFERNSSIFQIGTGKRSLPRIRPRFHDG